MPELSPITKDQAMKIVKALAYSFASGFVATFVLTSADFIKAAQDSHAAVVNLTTSLVAACVVGGINAVFVTIKQAFTPAKS